MNTKIFNDKNINKMNAFLEYLFQRGETYTISAKKEKGELILVVRYQ